MAQIEPSDNGGKKKKGAQKKISTHVDFTPMVDMNMLLITFFMLCTTMIKSQTLQIVLPVNQELSKESKQTEVKKSEAVTLILDTEYDENGQPALDPETGATIHKIYYYDGIADTLFTTDKFLREEAFIGNVNKEAQGIRKILQERNKEVMQEYIKLKDQWRNKEITKEQFDSIAKVNAADTLKQRPVVIIKPGPNATYEAFINALDEMQINQIARYNIEIPTHTDTILLEELQRRSGKTIIVPHIRQK